MEQNSAFYLKYRPQSLNDLFGQETVKKSLLGAFLGDKLSHAYLFVGPRGTGKTSTARILAKMINCESKGETPCNKCSICLSITDGSNMDLVEIDAASNRGIEDIRSLREKIKLSPTNSKKKVYIIDEVHMLTTEAFNALLKTLEEPPKHAVFILATTEVNKLPQTILSRVQRLDFKLASQNDLQDALSKIVKNEKIDISDEALHFLVKKAEGSFRDGVKLLDQISSVGEKITLESLQKSLKSSNFEIILKLLETIYKKDATQALTLVIKQVEEGVDIKELMLNLMDTFRNLMLIKHALGDSLVKNQLMEERYQELVNVGQNFEVKDLHRSLSILQESLEKLKYASIQSLPLELAVIEMCAVELENQQVVSDNAGVSISVKSEDLNSLISQTVVNTITDTLRADDHNSSIDSSPDIVKLKEKWTFVLETIRPYNFSLEALLRSINISACTETTLIMEVPYSFHQRILETPKNRDLLESIISEILGRSIRISTVLGVRPQRKEDIANIEVAADDEIIRAAADIFNSETIN